MFLREKSVDIKDGEPCGHVACLHHTMHPCEGCGRIGGKRLSKVETVIHKFPNELDYAMRLLMNDHQWLCDEEVTVKELHDGEFELYVGIRRVE